MSLRFRLLLLLGGMMILSLLITTGLAWYELGVEPQDPATPEEDQDEPMWWRVVEIVGRGAIPVMALVGGVWWVLQRQVRRVERLKLAAENLSRGNYGAQISPDGGSKDEITQLTEAFNRMSLKVRESFDQVREFTLHASHELKTPLTVLRSTFERRLTKFRLEANERDELASLLDEIERLTKIVDGLTLLTKTDSKLVALEIGNVPFHELVREAAEDCGALGEARQIQVSLDRCDSVLVPGDRHRLRQLLLIVADNAVKYNHPKGAVRWSLESEDDAAVLTVANSGRQLTDEEAARAFDRFFRGESNQSIEGCGLGLSIARWIAEAHQGIISLRPNSNSGGGAVVRLRLPRMQEMP